MKTCLCQPASKGYKVIIFELQNDILTRSWGLLNGSMQTKSTKFKPKNIGKTNEKSSTVVAKEDFARQVEKKCKNGYRVVDDITIEDIEKEWKQNDTMSFEQLPTNFAPAKPIKTNDFSKTKILSMIKELLNKNACIVTMKYNGLRHFVVVGENGIKIYTRRCDDHTVKYPTLVDIITKINLPAGTILDCELYIKQKDIPKEMFDRESDHMDRFQRVCSISKSDVSAGIPKDVLFKTPERIAETPVSLAIFDVLYYNTNKIYMHPYRARQTLIKEIDKASESDYIHAAAAIQLDSNSSPQEVYNILDELEDWEGLVIWDADSPTEVQMNGKSKRIGCFKLKPEYEDDFVAYEYEETVARGPGKIGRLKIGKYDSDGNIVPMGECGSGITHDLLDISLWSFPCVVEIKYSSKFKDTNRLQFPVFSKIHFEKEPSECTIND